MGERKYRRELTPVKQKNGRVKQAGERVGQVLQMIKREYPCLIDAVNYLCPVAVEEKLGCFCTDGGKLFYNAEDVGRGIEDTEMKLRILHIIYHGLLGHFSRGADYEQNRLAWDVMDLQVIRLFNETGINCIYGDPYQFYMGDVFPDVRSLFRDQTGFSLYYNARQQPALQRTIKTTMAGIGRRARGMLDDHTTWALPRLELKVREEPAPDGQPSLHWIDITRALTGLGKESFANGMPRELENALARALRESSARTFGRSVGGAEGGEVVAEAEGILRYESLIDEISKQVEKSEEDDEIDPAIYEYGLSLYGDVPMIEPLEYKFVCAPGNVVIAVDTSGSCGEYLREFWTETVEIFREIANRGALGGLHYLECDAEVSFEKAYESIDDLETAGNPVHSFSGFGGTDFRPVFERTAAYEKEGEKIDLLIYFSDGLGDYPDTEPQYPVYFVFPSRDACECCESMRPDWVKCLVLEKEECRHER